MLSSGKGFLDSGLTLWALEQSDRKLVHSQARWEPELGRSGSATLTAGLQDLRQVSCPKSLVDKVGLCPMASGKLEGS